MKKPDPTLPPGHLLVGRILDAYGVPYKNIPPPQKGYRNSSFSVDGRLNVILYKNEPGMRERIARTNAIGDFAATLGFPARRTYDPRIVRLQARGRAKYAAIYHYLPGNTIAWEAYTMERIKALGKAMGDLHATLAAYKGSLPDIATESIALNRRMVHYFAEPQVAAALQQKLGLRTRRTDFTVIFKATQDLPGQQALHMDFVRGNILFDGRKITGVIDFEKAARGIKLYDIARTLAFLLVDCKYKPAQKVRTYFLHSGYQKRSAATFIDTTIAGVSVLDGLTTFFLLHDFYKFLRHNPYESLPQNEHFARTKAMLLKRRLITEV